MRTTIHRSFGRRERIQPLRTQLADRRRITARVAPLERSMRRAAVVLPGRSLSPHLRVQVLLSAGLVRHVEGVRGRPASPSPLVAHTFREQVRTLATRHMLRQHLVERLTRSQPAAVAAPRVAFVTRVEQRRAAPRIQLTMVRQQPAVPPVEKRSAETPQPAVVDAPALPRQPRFAAPAAPLVLPPQEVSRLTDHVIRQLDHRVLSWQERTGRV